MVHSEEATNRKQWLVFIALAVVLIFVAIFWREETLLLGYRIAIIFASVLVCGYSFCHAIYSASMNITGVSCSYFGKLAHSIAWHEVEEVALIRDYRITLGSSGNRRLVVVPKGCPAYDSETWCGVHYLYRFRKQVIWMDNTARNREFIEERYGEIINRS